MIRGTVKSGRLEVNVPPDWPDGTEVEIHPVEAPVGAEADLVAAAETARVLALMDRVEPFEMSDVEQAAWDAQRQADREGEKGRFAERSERLRRMWD